MRKQDRRNKMRQTSSAPTVGAMPPYNPQFGKKHPYNNWENHQRLLRHVVDRLEMSRQRRDELAIRLRNIDLDINGFIKLDDEDRERMRQNRNGKGPMPVKTNLPLVLAKTDELLTFLLEVFWPANGMHAAYTDRENQPIAQGFALLLNQQAQRRQHYRKFGKFLFDALKYNIAAIETEWTEERGYKLKNNTAKQLEISKDELVWAGNDLHNIDMYNFFFDPTVAPVDVPTRGEYCGIVSLHSKFEIKRKASAGQLYGIERFIDAANDASVTFFQEKPIVRFDYNAYTNSVDWVKFATGAQYGTIGAGVELAKVYIWINPKEFGLSNDDEYQIWRVTVANHKYICDLEHMNNAHNMLPVAIAVPFEDNIGLQSKSAAEQLVDFQRFGSFMMNTHQEALRKALFGITVFDPSIVDLNSKGTDVAGRIPVNPAGYGKPIGDCFKHITDAPQTDNMLNEIEKVMQMMEQLMPTSMLKQVADLQRATTYQAAATVQGANRRNLKVAKVIDDQAVKHMRFQMMYNVMQFQQDIDIIDSNGNKVEVRPAKYRDLDIEYAIGEGLQGIDKLMVTQMMKDVIAMVVQNREASQEIDVVGLINYWTSLMGDKTDISQFRRQSPTVDQQLAARQQDLAEKQAAMGAVAQAHSMMQPPAGAQGNVQ